MLFSVLFKLIGGIILAVGISMSIPMVYAWYVNEVLAANGFFISVVTTLLLGGSLFFFFRKSPSDEELRPKEGFFIVSFSWLLMSVVGGLPFFFADVFPEMSFISFIDGFFESTSGFTTTGATIFADVESLPRSILLWRSITHWLGGMGIIVLSILILPLLGISGFQLFRAEVPGIKTDIAKLHPRIKDTAKALWGVYVLITFVEIILLMLGGMSGFDAVNHAFATMATGGFSTKNGSIGSYGSSYIEIVVTIFMFIAGANFALHYHAIRGSFKGYLRDVEFKWYIVIAIVAITGIAIVLGQDGESWTDAIRLSAFQVATILTTTGFSSADFELWPRLALLFLLTLMFIGGCAGSTGGGIKVVRILLFFKFAFHELFRLIHPNAVNQVKVGKHSIEDKIVMHLWGFLFLVILTMSVSMAILFASGVDLESSIMAVIACLGNIGPGLASVGPSDNYAHFSPLVKTVLTFCMIAGRLELYTVFILLIPQLWRN